MNKVSSKADVRVDIGALEGIFSLEELAAIRQVLANRLDAEGRLQVQADEYRDQGRNLEAARGRIAALLDGALYRPKKRKASRPSAGARERRLSEKKRRSRIKNLRHPRPGRE